MTSQKRLARVAGILYLLLAISSVFAEMYVRATIVQRGNPTVTAHNIAASAALYRLGFLADLAAATLFLFVGFALYLLLRHVAENVARALVVCVGLGVAIMCMNTIHQFAALLVATDDSYAASLSPAGSDALVRILTDMNHYGFLIAQIFFGVWLLPLGYLAYKSGMFPRALGVLLMVGCFSYLVDMLIKFLVPAVETKLSTLVLLPAVIAEFWTIGCLLVKRFEGTARSPLVEHQSPRSRA